MTGRIDSTKPDALNPSTRRVSYLKRQQEKKHQKKFNRHLRQETGKNVSGDPEAPTPPETPPGGASGQAPDSPKQGRMIDITV